VAAEQGEVDGREGAAEGATAAGTAAAAAAVEPVPPLGVGPEPQPQPEPEQEQEQELGVQVASQEARGNWFRLQGEAAPAGLARAVVGLAVLWARGALRGLLLLRPYQLRGM
jgi:hypothetical protein